MMLEDKVKMKVWYRKWENCDSISLQEIEWAEQLFTKEIAEYDFQFITTNQFLDYIQNSPEMIKNIDKEKLDFDFVELVGH